MRNPVAQMPWPLRAAFGVFVTGVFAFVGASFWESSRVAAYVLFGLAALRLWAVIRLARALGSWWPLERVYLGVAWVGKFNCERGWETAGWSFEKDTDRQAEGLGHGTR